MTNTYIYNPISNSVINTTLTKYNKWHWPADTQISADRLTAAGKQTELQTVTADCGHAAYLCIGS